MAKSFKRSWEIIFKGLAPVAVFAAMLCAVSGAGAAPILPNITTSGVTLRLRLEADMGVTQSGGLVSQWADQSGNGFDAEQTVAAKQPTLVANASANGLYSALRFDGVKTVADGDALINTTAVVQDPATGGTTFFIVYNSKGAPLQSAPFFYGVPENAHGILRGIWISPVGSGYTGNLWYTGWNEGLDSGFVIPNGESRMQTFTMNDTRNSVSIYDRVLGDAASTHIITGSPGTVNNVAPGYSVGGQSPVNPTAYYLNGDISAILVYTGQLSDADRIAVDNYLYEKYFSAVPEPSSFLLIGASAFGLLGLRRRRA